MELINATRLAAAFTLGREPDGREALVVVIKGTFSIPPPGGDPRLRDEQLPLVMADTFTGEPGFSSPLLEMDFAPRKKACDVLLLGSAHAPGGRPVTRVEVELRAGPLRKRAAVVGDRAWRAGPTGTRASAPELFVRMPISYDVAFGGADREPVDPSQHDAYASNPVGRGFRKHLKAAWVEGRPLPNTEEPGEAVTSPTGRYRPMAFGPVGRGWAGRREFAGTYDQAWLENVFPFLPVDFDERYFQAAPPDQQIPIGDAPCEVSLVNLTPDGLRQFVLPSFAAPVHVFPKRGPREELAGRLDTVVLEPEHERFTMTWRASRPLRNSLFDIAQVVVGRKGGAWWQRRDEVSFPIPVVMVPMNSGAAAGRPS
jgi:hypothetical protein